MDENRPTAESIERKRSNVYRLSWLLLLGVALLLAATLSIVRESNLRAESRKREKTIREGPIVTYVTASMAKPERTIELVGEARPYFESTLYAKVSGYLKEINVDYGDEVKEGQVLAVVESPELDRQYDAALDDFVNKDLLAKRGYVLLPQKAISAEDAQNRDYTARISKSTAASIEAQKEYEIIRAPFTGTITARYADPGALVQNATTTQTAALPVVTVSKVDKLKVYAYSDQNNANYIQVGDRAEIWDSTRSEEKVPATVSRTSVELSARTRTLLLQFDVDNTKRVLVPGSFVRLALVIKTPPRVEVPVEALIFRGNVPFVAVITENNTVAFHQVAIAFSDAKTARLLSGVKEGERVAMNLGAGVEEGDTVRPVPVKQ